MRQEESRPDDHGTALNHTVGTGIQETAQERVLDLAVMRPHGQHVALAYYEAGHQYGYAAGYDAAVAEQTRLDRLAAGLGSMLATTTDYAALCERRGEPGRAEAQRRTLTERGIF